MLRVLDVRTGSYAELRPARAGLLRLCAHVPGTAAETDITWLRVLLAGDVLTRAAGLQKLQVLTVLAFADEETIGHWRRQVARWAESPSPVDSLRPASSRRSAA